MTGIQDKRLVFFHILKIHPYQTVLHPILKNLAAFAVGDQFIGIKRHVEIEIVVDHQLKCPCLQDMAPVFFDWPGPYRSFRAIAIAVDPASGEELCQEFRGQFFVKPGGDVAQGIFQGDFGLLTVQREAPARGAPDPGKKSFLGWKRTGKGKFDCFSFQR